jgi:hypothetical protein
MGKEDREVRMSLQTLKVWSPSILRVPAGRGAVFIG